MTAVLSDPVSPEGVYASALAERAERASRRRESPLVRLWDGDWNFRGRVFGEISSEFRWVLNDTGTGTIVLPADHHLAKWAASFRSRGTKNVHVTVDKDGARWGGRVSKVSTRKVGPGEYQTTLEFADFIEDLKHIRVWSNPVLPSIIQFPRVFMLAGPSIWSLKLALFLNLMRNQNSLFTLPDNPLDFSLYVDNLNMENWPVSMKGQSFLDDSSPHTIVSSRFKNWHEMAAPILNDAQLMVKYDIYLDGDPDPWPGYTPRNGQVIYDIVDKSGWWGSTGTGGNVLNETGKPEQILNWDQITQIQGVMRDAMRVVRDLGAQFGYEKDAELIAEAIGERLDKTDWEAVALRLGAFTEQADKVLRTAGDSFADDALGVFGVRNGRKRFEEYAAIGKALSGESDAAAVSADMSGVPSPESVISGATSSRSLPSVSQKKMALETDMPDIAEGGGGPVKDQVRQAFAKYGWDKEPYWGAVDWIVGKESTWNPTARNPSSGAFGLFQFLGGTKDTYLPDENTNPAVQGAAGAKYIKDRYGDPLKARAFWEKNGWYDKGGVLSPGTTLAQNDSGKDELILNNRAWHDMSTTVVAAARNPRLAPAGVVGGSRGGDTINLYTEDTDNAIRAFRRREAQKAQSRIGLR